MKSVVSTVLLFLLNLSAFLYAVDKKYIPSNIDSVLSFNANTLSQKANINLQFALNNFFMQEYADRYLEYRDDNFVADVMTNKLNDYIDFSKTSRIVFFNGYQQMSIIFDVKNLTELDKLMIKMASQEDKLISIADNAIYRYLYLDEYNIISWNKDIFVITSRLKNSYWYSEELNKDDIINIVNYIFFNTISLDNEKFLSLENKNNDFYIWINLSIISENNNFAYYLFGKDYDILRNIYKDAIFTSELNFNNGYFNIISDIYTPNYDNYDNDIRKELSDNIYNFVDGKNNYGFLSFAFNSKELSKQIIDIFKDYSYFQFYDNKFKEEYGIDTYKLLELLGGDIFISLFGDKEDRISLLASVSIVDIDSVKNILETLSDESSNDIYNIYGYYCYIKDSIIYISNELDVINSIINNEVPTEKIDSKKLDIAKNNTFSLYIENELYKNLAFIKSEIEFLESMYFTINILDNDHIQIVFNMDMIDKEKNSLEIIKYFIGLE